MFKHVPSSSIATGLNGTSLIHQRHHQVHLMQVTVVYNIMSSILTSEKYLTQKTMFH